MQPDSSETEKTKPRLMPPPENDTKQSETQTPPRSELAAIGETQPAQSGDSRANLEMAAFRSLNLLNKSADRLMGLIEECVTDSDLAKSKEGTQRVETHRIETAISAANALAASLQTGANMVKAMTDLIKRGDT